MKKSLSILLALFLGACLPMAEVLQPLIRYNLMMMLFLSFLKIRPGWQMFTRAHVKVLLLNLCLPFAVYFLIVPFDPIVAAAALIITVAPTAIAAPIIADLMQRDIAYIIASIILTSLGMALAIPFILQWTLEIGGEGGMLAIVTTILITVFVPFVISQGIVLRLPQIHQRLLSYTHLTFVFFLCNIFIAGASATHFIRFEATVDYWVLLRMVIVIGLVCLIHFRLGRYLDRADLAIESSIALGRKNTMMALWLALTFIDPLTALGPICYVFWQNLYHAWEIGKEGAKVGGD